MAVVVSVLLWRRSDTSRMDDVIFAKAVRLTRTLDLARRNIAGSGRSGLLLVVRAY